ncbi:Peptidase C1A papain C-terminal domain-containing protein [Caenorhabditis elegans]|uniref:Peptidase C1A papain C-terminal domain-containing protein n=1 Tax=Caenorhabditis elegans TaxID=6239 RepID=P91110_CAEEL|nr:Peptidase C1A papain C-terminal domain-containing protein [Caenorhabditis elegans]CCD66354.1 Peptidase C1A papain C-terminal domain-containing protein [Caenorhabditis elegans]|eukprot:NP_493866.1 Uncharacterized protein CELE_C32B5.13 [Caenorhabditis elegans]
MYAKANNRTVLSFSEQQIIDCGNFTSPCQENILSHEFIKKNGVVTEADYPYVGKENEKCKYDENKIKLWPTNMLLVGNLPETLLKLFIKEHGPGYFRMKAPPSFFNYKTGIYSPTQEECGKATDARSLTIVGYGIEGGQNYWIVKGSFGT